MTSEAGSSKVLKLAPTSFDELNVDLQSAALNSTKLAAALPADISFHRSVDHDYAQAIEACSEKALSLTNKLLSLVTESDPTRSSRAKGKRKLEDQEDVVDKFHTVVIDALDQLFERGDSCLDEFLGRSKPTAIVVKPPIERAQAAASTSQAQQNSASRLGRLDPSILHASYLPKPQLKFKTRVDNTDTSRWIPRLKHKYNAQVPLGLNLHDETILDGSESVEQSLHLYRYEIEHISYPQRMFAHSEAVPPRSFGETPFTWIDTQDGLSKLLDKLRVAPEIAVDLEHHSYRSFAGFLCLMQISTREEDFVVDTLALREELQELNEVFTDPKIVKVFHGAESDIVWLQQNFNLYIVNLFDTFHASKVLDFPKHGLAALLTMYCDYIPDKRYQLADWRIRPLPMEMLDYARSDTHFLLFIFDNLRNALLDRAGGQPDLIHTVLKRSEETALRTYEKEVYDFEFGLGPGGWDTLASKWNKALSGLQFEVFRAVHGWRNRIAREEDESTQYVLPNRYLFELADRPPADMAALLSIFRPVPPLVRTKATSLLETIRAAVKESLSPKLGNDSVDSVKPSETAHVIPMDEDEPSTGEKVSADESKSSSVLWSSQKHNISASSSSFLGQKTGKPHLAYSSSGSSLFSFDVLQHPVSHASGSSSRYQEVVSRVHSSLAIAPSAPKVDLDGLKIANNASVAEFKTNTGFSEANAAAISEKIETPPSQMKTIVSESVDDTIVVVGKAKQKKRKRTKTQEQSDEEPKEEAKESVLEGSAKKKKSKKSTETTQDESESPEPFDYASAPNFLDEPARVKSDIKKSQAKSKGKKGKTIEYGNFPAPPRAYNEVKGGGRSQTFR